MVDRNIVQELRLLGSLDCPYGCDEVGNPAADAIEELTVERDASRLILSDLTAEVDRLRAAGDALAKCVNQFGDIDNWTHDDGFLFHDEALAAIAAWEEARRER